MRKLKYFICIILATIAFDAQALDIQYGTVLETRGSDILIEYYGIEQKENFLCSTISMECTKKEIVQSTINTNNKKIILNKALNIQLQKKHATRITMSQSGEFLAYYRHDTGKKKTRIYTLRNIKTKKERSTSEVISYWDLVDHQSRVFAFSPNSKNLVYLDDLNNNLALYIVSTKTNANNKLSGARLSTRAYQIDDFIFTDNQTIYYIGNTRKNPYHWSLHKYKINDKTDTIVAEKVSYADPLRKVGSMIVFNQLHTLGYGPAVYNLVTKKVQQFSIPTISTGNTVKNQEIIDSSNIHGVLMTAQKDDHTKTYPLVIWLHGGPYRQSSFGYHPFHSYGIYDSILNLLSKNDVLVLKLDYPGSFGFGRDYAESIKGSVGTTDVDTVMNAVAYMKNRYHISNIYLAGNSYGGYLSLRTIVEHPKTFAGALSINGVTDWESLLVHLQTSIFNIQFYGLPNQNNQELYNKASIINKISALGNQKIEIIQAENDKTIPSWQADFLYEKLHTMQKNVNIIKYREEDHVFKKKKTISDLCMQMFTFVGIPIDQSCNS